MSDDLSTPARLVRVLDHLGLGRTHVAAMIPGDIAALPAATPDRLAGVVFCTPFFLDPAPFAKLADRVLLVSGEYGPTFDVTVHAADRLAGAERCVLDGYEAQTWSDVAADRTVELADRRLVSCPASPLTRPGLQHSLGTMLGFPTALRAAGRLCCCCRFFTRRRNGRRRYPFWLAISPSSR